MLTENQEIWINHLLNDSKIKIVPFDPTSQEKFEKIKSKIQSKLGKSVCVEHRGASSLGISGQDEIDVYIPVSSKRYDNFVALVTKLFGEPRSHYHLRRTRFRVYEGGKCIDLFVINKESFDWINGLKFEDYLKNHPKALEKYKKLKEAGNGLGTQEYYRRKTGFINSILSRI